MKKTIAITIACLCVTLSCIGSGIPKRIRNAFMYCYSNAYTGLDTLINIEGYYSAPTMVFYNNGFVISPVYRYEERFLSDDFLFLEKIIENPKTKDAEFFYKFMDCGSYVICDDTIKVQMMHKSWSWNDDWRGREYWYKIIDKNTLLILNSFLITTDKKEKEFEKKYRPFRGGLAREFVPVPIKPPLDYYWILREKWFWCNEKDWKAHMEKMKQREKEK